MQKTKPIVIDGDDYTMTQLGAITGRRIWLKLAKVIAAPMRVLGTSKGLSEETMAAALAAAIEDLDEQTVEELYAAFGPRCTVRIGERTPELIGEVFDQHFAGRYLSMSKWLLECVLFNFADFLGPTSLGSIVTTIQAMTKRAEQVSRSPKDSTGTSGES